MEFEKKVPQWDNVGTEPPDELKSGGWKAEYKPPAAYFNWFWNRVSACLTEIREKMLEMDSLPDSEKSVKHATTADKATLADKVANSFKVQLNGGTKEGENLWTFDGSSEKNVNITPSAIGAAEKNHEDPVTTAGSGAAFTAAVNGITALAAGVRFTMIPHTASTTIAPTLDVNGLGAKNIRRRLSSGTASTTTGGSTGWLGAGKPINMVYDGTYWIADLPQPNSADIYGTLAVDDGGTGATTPEAARTNLGAAPAYDYGTEDLTAGTSALETGKLYFVYE